MYNGTIEDRELTRKLFTFVGALLGVEDFTVVLAIVMHSGI